MWDRLTRDYEVEFRETIGRMIPFLNDLTNDLDQDVRRKTVELLGKLGYHGEDHSLLLLGQTQFPLDEELAYLYIPE